MKVVINRCYGGFGLSDAAEAKYLALTGKEEVWGFELERNDPVLIQIVEELGNTANSSYAELKVVEIPDDVEWTIQDYDGVEWIAEVHRTWQ